MTRGKVVARIANPKFDVAASQHHTLHSAHTGGGGLSAGGHAGVWVMRPGASLGGLPPACLPPLALPGTAKHGPSQAPARSPTRSPRCFSAPPGRGISAGPGVPPPAPVLPPAARSGDVWKLLEHV